MHTDDAASEYRKMFRRFAELQARLETVEDQKTRGMAIEAIAKQAAILQRFVKETGQTASLGRETKAVIQVARGLPVPQGGTAPIEPFTTSVLTLVCAVAALRRKLQRPAAG